MNNRYLFRGKELDTGTWMVGSFLAEFKGDAWIVSTEKIPELKEEAQKMWWKVREKTVGQCTGLKDKNEQLIFEGDIIIDGMERKSVVVWHDGMATFVAGFISADEIGTCTLFNANTMQPRNLQVLGNIHDNPEWPEEERKS